MGNPTPPHDAAPARPTRHVPVMVDEVVAGLQAAPGMTILDGTLGGGGHTSVLARGVLPTGKVIAVDRDPTAVARAGTRLSGLPVELVHAPYDELFERGVIRPASLDGALFDLGLSSDQLSDAERGFSYDADGTLDLRYDRTSGRPAWELLAQLDERVLADVIYRFGEERFSRRIARRIVEARRREPIRTARQLADVVRRSVRRSRGHSIDPATRTFQALRIAANDELGRLERLLDQLPDWLRAGGRVAVITFHSLEDRIVKHAFRDDPRWEVITRKPQRPSRTEREGNRRCRSAKLRLAARADRSDRS